MEDMVLIRYFSKEYKHKRINYEWVMEKSVLDIIESISNQKQGLTTSYVRDIEGNLVVKLLVLNI